MPLSPHRTPAKISAPATREYFTEDATIGYDKAIISRDLSVAVPDGSFTAIIGPNGCGKSTLLRALARVLKPAAGRVLLDGKAIQSYPSKEVARTLGLLPQSSLAPDGIRVADLVARGRAPYQSLIQQWRQQDEEAVAAALEATKLTPALRQTRPGALRGSATAGLGGHAAGPGHPDHAAG